MIATRFRRVLLAALAAAVPACSSPPPGVTGFLGDYTGFERVDDPARDAWVWRRGGADLRDYDKVMVDAVAVQPAPGSRLAAVDRSLAQRHADEFHRTFLAVLAPYHTVVLSPGPHTLRVRVALTEAAPASDGAAAAVAFEGELLDATTGERLAAAIERVAPPSAGGSPDDPVRAAFSTWAHRLVDYLELHGAE